MNLRHLVEQYLAFRQALGERFRSHGFVLRAFSRAVGEGADVVAVTPEQVSAFLAGTGPVTSAWHVRCRALRGFYRYALSRGYATTIPLPALVPKLPPPFVPYIYSQEELRRLLDATNSYSGRTSSIEPVTGRTVVLLLYAAALRRREAINLDRADVDLNRRVLTVRQTKFFKTRLVPLGAPLSLALTRYIQRPLAAGATPPDPRPFFTTRTGARLRQHRLQGLFRPLRAHAGIRRLDGARYQPRLHDLRHSFAIHRLISWYRQGLDVQKLLPHLSVYLGHACLKATQVYLSMTPELLQEASQRFEHYFWEEDDHD